MGKKEQALTTIIIITCKVEKLFHKLLLLEKIMQNLKVRRNIEKNCPTPL